MKVIVSLAVVAGIFLVGYFGAAAGMAWVFAVAVPYVAVVMLLVGLVRRVMSWAASPVPFRIPTTCGQQKSLSWIKQEKLPTPGSGPPPWPCTGRCC